MDNATQGPEPPQAEGALPDTTEARFIALFEQSPISTMIYDCAGRPVRVNAAFTRLWGLTLADLQPGYRILADQQLAEQGMLPLIRRAFAGEAVTLPPFYYDAAPQSPAGRARWAEAFLYPITSRDGDVREVVLTQFDVTERIAGEQALRRAEVLARGQVEALTRTIKHLADSPRLDALLSQVLYEIIQQIGAASGSVFVYNPADDTLERHTSVCDGQVARSPQPGDPPDRFAPFPATGLPLLDTLGTTREVVLIAPDEPQLDWIDSSLRARVKGQGQIAVYVLRAGDQFVGVLGMTFPPGPPLSPDDIQLIQTLGQQAALAIQLTHLAYEARQVAVLEERTRLAREIHDTLAQGFTGIIVQLQTAEVLAASDPTAQQAHLALALDLAKQSLIEARRSVQALRAPALLGTDLAGALLRLVRQLPAPLAAHFAVSGAPVALPPEIEGQLLRIGQEAITNVVRHARATTLRVELHFDPDLVWLRVADDGAGFVAGAVAGDHYGLVGMRERAQQLGASLEIDSAPGRGTAIVVSVPITGAKTAEGQ